MSVAVHTALCGLFLFHWFRCRGLLLTGLYRGFCGLPCVLKVFVSLECTGQARCLVNCFALFLPRVTHAVDRLHVGLDGQNRFLNVADNIVFTVGFVVPLRTKDDCKRKIIGIIPDIFSVEPVNDFSLFCDSLLIVNFHVRIDAVNLFVDDAGQLLAFSFKHLERLFVVLLCALALVFDCRLDLSESSNVFLSLRQIFLCHFQTCISLHHVGKFLLHFFKIAGDDNRLFD